MIVIGEKINGAIPKTGEAIANRDAEYIKKLVMDQEAAGADYLDVCAATDPELEYDALCWLIDTVQEVNTKPSCIDSPDPNMLVKVFPKINKPGLINSISLEGNKCEILLPLLRDNPEWGVIALCSSDDGVSYTTESKVDLACKLIEKAGEYGVTPDRMHIDLLVFAVSAVADSCQTFCEACRIVKEKYPTVNITEALSNISYGLPVRKSLNMAFLTLSMNAGLDSLIGDPLNRDVKACMLATDVLLQKDRHCRKYSTAFRKGEIGPVKA